MRLFAVAILGSLLVSQADAQGVRPDPYASRLLMGAESYTWEAVRGQGQQANAAARQVTPYGGGATAAALSPIQRPARPAATGIRRPATKPFNTIVQTPTLSPYLNLYREEAEDAAPNYHTFVRPMQRQQETNRRQINQLQQLQQQVRQASYAPPASGGSGAARYGDTGHFYGGWR